MKNERFHNHRLKLRVVAASFLLLIVFGSGYPLAASAQLNVNVAANSYETQKELVDNLVGKPFEVAFMMIIWNFLQFISQRIAYDAAVAIATAGSGEEPLINLQDPGAYVEDLSMDVAGAAVDAMTEGLSVYGVNFNLCAPQSPAFLLVLQLGIKSAYQRPEPSCDFNSFVTNWQGFVADSFGDDYPDQALLTNFAKAINPRTTDLTAGIALYTNIISDADKQESIGFAKYLADKGYKDVSNVITGNVETPANLIEKNWDYSQVWSGPGAQEANVEIFKTMISAKDLWAQMGLSALSTFTNTLLSKLTDRVYSGLFDVQIDSSSPFDASSTGFAGGVEAAEAHFRSIYAVAPIQLDTYNIISEFTTCPTSGSRGLNYCVMDANFATAVGSAESGEPFTVAEAIEEGLINGDWPLISSADSRNIDANCYTYGFCYANLVRMRLARVIPVGWEIAAEAQDPDASDTLQTVIDAFDDESSPYYHLIDPNWVLKYPASQCDAAVFGQLVSDTGTGRAQECVDAPSCIREDANGACVGGYGYCALEKNAWNFRGEDCPEHYASCLSFDNGDGVEGNWLYNTLDVEDCSASNAGCLWYQTSKEETDGEFDWPSGDDLPADEASDTTYLSRLYFNGEVEECDEEDAGCARVIQKTDDINLNLMLNSSFEDDTDDDALPDYWALTGGSAFDDSGNGSQFGSSAVKAGSGGTSGIVYQTGVPLQQSTFYTLSFYAAQENSSSNYTGTVYLVIDSEDGSQTVDLTGTSYDEDNCTLTDLDGDGSQETLAMSVTPSDENYERFACVFTSPTFDDSALMPRVQYLEFIASGLYVDGVQLEADEDISDYAQGYGESLADLALDYYKLPPSYLGCTGDSDVDPEECGNYASVCSAQDVGCNLYTPVNGDPSVPGIVSDLDECPSECAGYDTYKQEATNYEPDGEFPVYFIPSTAISCSQTYVGCDEFTNLADESLAYYTYLRTCLTTAQTTSEANYYTWEGSDLEGFQLKSWSLLQSDLTDAPCVDWTTTSSTITCNDDAAEITDDEDCNEHDDIFTEPDCREFYDAGGDIHYRRFSETVTITDACQDYRKTDLVGDDATEKQDNCEGAGGYYDATLGECRFYGYDQESDSCPSSQNGCREYTGGAGRNSSVVFDDDFEDDDIDEYTVTDASAETSNESVATDGHSVHVTVTTDGGYFALSSATMDDCSEATCETDSNDNDGDGSTADCGESDGCDAAVGTLGLTCTIDQYADSCGALAGALAQNKVYVLSFWAKGASNGVGIQPQFVEEAGAGRDLTFDAVTLTTNWEKHTVGPLDVSASKIFDDSAWLAFLVSDTSTGNEFYLDNIVLRQTEEAVTVIKDSWDTPAACDQTPEGAASDQYMLGCAEYTDVDGESVYLKSFTRLCSEDKVGCDVFYNTQSSDSPYGAVYNLTCERGLDPTTTELVGTYHPDLATPYALDDVGALPCIIDDITYCTIAEGESSCQFDITEGGIPRMDDGSPLYEETSVFGLGFSLRLTPDVRVVTPDSLTYFVADDEFACDDQAMGCTEAGLPTLNSDQSRVDSWESVYLLDVVDSYDSILCTRGGLFCDAFDSTQDGTFYFKNPVTKTCDYRAGVTIDGAEYSGWFRTGSNEFCYGTGTCSVGGNACELDADCVASTSSETDECVIDTGSYLHGGSESRIWRNGDVDNYDGWVGKCEAQYDLCTDFVDPVDVKEGDVYGEDSGTSYFFLDNASLDESNLPASKRCSGQVSQKQGCVLFDNTVSAELNYSASASYNLSVHANEFYSNTDSYDLVDPISCPDGGDYTTLAGVDYDLCATRCAYQNSLLHPYDDYTNEEGADLYTFTTACLENSDCPDLLSDAGDTVSGSCQASTFTGVDGTTVTVPSLQDDANDIKKVNLDRACAEWLSCTSTQKVWDENAQAYVNVCDRVGLCDEYTSSGEATACASWIVDKPAMTLTDARYKSRNVSWYGREYSGYSIPDQILPNLLSQVNVNPASWCTDYGGTPIDASRYTGSEDIDTSLPYVDCSLDDTLCDDVTGAAYCQSASDDFRLVYDAGDCAEGSATGDDCTIGFCEDSGDVCADDDDCDTGSAEQCARGYCGYPVPSTYTPCLSNGDCADQGDYNTCGAVESGEFTFSVCVKATSEACASDSQCTSEADGNCQESAKYHQGMCVNGSCLVTPQDSAFDFDDDAIESLECRGWPEQTSPFPNSVVETWVSPVTGATTETPTVDSQPRTVLSTFEDVSICAGGEECSCSYDKLTYSSNVVYVDAGGTSALSYVCVGGSYDGSNCTLGDTVCETGGGVCTRLESQQTQTGLQGFCLQRDTALVMNGDQSQAPCLAWLPIDRAAGATDIYGKATEAGYPLEDTFYCAEPAMYVDLKMSIIDSDPVYTACAEHEGSGSSCDDAASNQYDCDDNVVCPGDYYALMGRCWQEGDAASGDEVNTYAYLCTGVGDVGDNDCPYVCVPEESYDQDGNACDDIVADIGSGSTNSHGTKVYTVKGKYEKFNETVATFASCTRKGVEYSDELVDEDHLDIPFEAYSGDEGYTRLFLDGVVYPGCKTIYQTADTEENFGWTNRLWSGGDFTISDGSSAVDYVYATGQSPFGKSNAPTVYNELGANSYPAPIASCLRQPINGITTDGATVYTEDDLISGSHIALSLPPSTNVCDPGPSDPIAAPPNIDSLEEPDARSFVDLDLSSGYMMSAFSYGSDDLADGFDRIVQLFARPLTAWVWNATSKQYEDAEDVTSYVSGTLYEDVVDDYYNRLEDGDSYTDGDPHGPTIISVDTDECNSQYCQEGSSGRFTINGKDDDDLTGADGTYFADMKFFVEANPNQMPLRRVIVEWGDEEGGGDQVGSRTDDNYYKNRRGLSGLDDNQICGTSTDWGTTSLACDSNYFNVQHYFTCSSTQVDLGLPQCETDSDGHLAESPCTGGDQTDGVCVFQPRVHVRDNWGWCTGECSGRDAGCFDGDGVLGASTDKDECNFEGLPNGGSWDPWIYYDGVIELEP